MGILNNIQVQDEGHQEQGSKSVGGGSRDMYA